MRSYETETVLKRCLTRLGVLARSSLLSMIAWVLASTPMQESARAGEFEYQECIRQLCTSYGLAEYDCVQSCLKDLNGPAKTMSLQPVPVLYGAIAIEDRTLITGYAKGEASRADAERQALANCRSAGGGISQGL